MTISSSARIWRILAVTGALCLPALSLSAPASMAHDLDKTD